MKKGHILALRIFLALSVIVCAALFVIQTACIYKEAAEQMYTSEIIAQHFNAISWAPVAMLTLIVVGAFLPFPDAASNVPVEFRTESILKRVDVTEKSLASLLKRSRRIRVQQIVLAAICCAALIMIGTRKTLLVSMDLEYAVGKALPLLAIPVVILFAGESVLSYFSCKCAEQIVETVRGMEKMCTVSASSDSEKTIRIIRILVYAAAVALIIAGICNGGMNGVFVKATIICTECIGLG